MITDLLRKRTYTSLLSESPDWLLELLGTSTTAHTGETITPATAMYNSVVFACVRILAETIASLPLILYERQGRGKERATGHRIYRMLHEQPNPEMTRTEMWEALVGHVATWGNAYANIVWSAGGYALELWPLRPDYMEVLRGDDGQLRYLYSINGEQYGLQAYQVLHLRGLSNNGIAGYSPIRHAREAIALSMATEEHGATFFANSATPGGILTHPGRLQEGARTNLKSSWEAAHKGLDYAHRIAVLEEGVTWQQIGIPNEDAQFLETRKFQVQEIARMFRIPPHMLADLDRATFSNIEHQSIEFVTFSLMPWLKRIEQRINITLLSKQERNRYYAEHLVDGLLRGDTESRYNAYAVARQNGWMSANDIRELENMNPVDGGDVYLVPLNMMPADQVGAPEIEPVRSQFRTAGIGVTKGIRANGGGSAESRRRIAQAYKRLVADATRRILRREEADVMRQASKMLTLADYGGFLAWLREFYAEHPAFFRQYMAPVLTSLAEQIAEDANAEIGQEGGLTRELERFLDEYIEAAAAQYVSSNEGQLRQVLGEAEDAQADPIEALQERFDEWQAKTPDKIAMRQTVRASNAVTHEVWYRSGVSRKVWATHGENCPYCNALRGTTVSITETFLRKDDVFEPEDADRPLTFTHDIGHPPAHDGCDCGIAPG